MVVRIDLSMILFLMSVRLGVLGLCAIVLSSPYDIPTYIPDALMFLCEHSHDPDLIQVGFYFCSIRCISLSLALEIHEIMFV